jgi:hypothetical protein
LKGETAFSGKPPGRPPFRPRWFYLGVWTGFKLFYMWLKLYWLDQELARIADRVIAQGHRKRFHPAALADYEDLRFISALSRTVLRRIMHTDKPCLAKSLCLFDWCAKRGIKADLLVGVSKDDGLLSGHAWLELGGRPLGESANGLKGFTVMMRMDSEHGLKNQTPLREAK